MTVIRPQQNSETATPTTPADRSIIEPLFDISRSSDLAAAEANATRDGTTARADDGASNRMQDPKGLSEYRWAQGTALTPKEHGGLMAKFSAFHGQQQQAPSAGR